MNCSKCPTQNEDNANYCKNCGTNLYAIAEPRSGKVNTDNLLLIYILVAVIAAVAEFSIRQVVPNWYDSPVKYLQGSFWILQNLSFILIPFAIKNQTLKIIGLSISCLIVLYWLYQNSLFFSN